MFFIEYVFFFLVYSVLGWLYESALCSVRERRPVFRGFLAGPYCPIYGFGALLILLLLGRLRNPALLFILGASVTCTLEYFTSLAMESFFRARWWDYSRNRFNLGGRVCLLGAAAFGAFSVFLVLQLHPFVTAVMRKITPEVLAAASVTLLGVLACDFTATVIRSRRKAKP